MTNAGCPAYYATIEVYEARVPRPSGRATDKL